MGAGQLRDKVTFQRQAAGVGDGAGNYGTAFAAIAGATAIAASIQAPRGSEGVSIAGVQGRVAFNVVIRYTTAGAGITVNDRMIDARDPTKIYNVKTPAVNLDGRRKYLTIVVELGGAAG